MDFTSALLYPFKSIAKVMTIVLTITIAIAVFVGLLLNSFDWTGFIEALQFQIEYQLDYFPFYESPTTIFIPALIGFIIVGIITLLWSSGYSVRVIRHVMEGYEKLPNIQLGKDMKAGFYLFLLDLLYGGIFFVFIVSISLLVGLFTGSNGESGLSGLIILGAFLVAIPFMVLLGWAYFIAMARYAADDNRGALFQMRTNLRIARQNVKVSSSLTGYLILLGLTFWFVSQFVSNVLQLFATPFFGRSQDQTSLLISLVVSLILTLALNIIQEFSRMHLIAQYAYKIGLYDEYDPYNDDKVDFV